MRARKPTKPSVSPFDGNGISIGNDLITGIDLRIDIDIGIGIGIGTGIDIVAVLVLVIGIGIGVDIDVDIGIGIGADIGIGIVVGTGIGIITSTGIDIGTRSGTGIDIVIGVGTDLGIGTAVDIGIDIVLRVACCVLSTLLLFSHQLTFFFFIAVAVYDIPPHSNFGKPNINIFLSSVQRRTTPLTRESTAPELRPPAGEGF